VIRGIQDAGLNESLYFNSRAQTETLSLQKESDIREIVHAIRKRKIQFVLFDVFRRLWDGDENDNQEVAKIVAQMTRIQNETGCQVAMIHHVNKASEGTIFQRIRGASALYGWIEWGIGVSNMNPDAPKIQQVRKMVFETKADEGSEPMYYRIANTLDGISILECDPPEPKKKTKPIVQTKHWGDQE
jgi:hypothetical protein